MIPYIGTMYHIVYRHQILSCIGIISDHISDWVLPILYRISNTSITGRYDTHLRMTMEASLNSCPFTSRHRMQRHFIPLFFKVWRRICSLVAHGRGGGGVEGRSKWRQQYKRNPKGTYLMHRKSRKQEREGGQGGGGASHFLLSSRSHLFDH